MKIRTLIDEINNLDIKDMGVDEDQIPWVSLQKGFKFHGIPPDDYEKFIFDNLRSNHSIRKECIGVIIEIIERYLAPRSIPEELTNSKSRYNRLRDPLEDFSFNSKNKSLISNLFKPNKSDTILDIGAYHGFGTMRLAEYVGAGGTIIAVEADKINAQILKKNIIKNDLTQIKYVNVGVSNFNSKGTFFWDGEPSGNSLNRQVLEDLNVKVLKQIQIPIQTGDKILADFNLEKIDYLSITINGGEPEAVLGLRNTIERSNNIKVTMPGWYFRDGSRLDSVLIKILKDMNFSNIHNGKKGRVIAWK